MSDDQLGLLTLFEFEVGGLAEYIVKKLRHASSIDSYSAFVEA